MLELTKGDTPLVFPKFENEDKMTESEICCKCSGCCRYVSVDITKPRSKDQIDLYVWYLLHKNVQIYIDNDKGWNLLFITPAQNCKAMGSVEFTQLVRNYVKTILLLLVREREKDHTHLFMTPDALLAYLEDEKKKKQTKSKTKVVKKTKKTK